MSPGDFPTAGASAQVVPDMEPLGGRRCISS